MEPGGPSSLIRPYVRLLAQNPCFRWLWFADIVDKIGDWFNFVALVSLTESLSSAAGAVVILLLTRFVPSFFFSPFGGVAADRHNKFNLLLASNVFRSVLVLGYLIVQPTGSLPLMYFLSFLQFSAASFTNPSHSALVPELVGIGDIFIANALDSITWSTTLALGAFFGGVVVQYVGTSACFFLDSMSYMLCAVLLWRARSLAPSASASASASRIVTLADVKSESSASRRGSSSPRESPPPSGCKPSDVAVFGRNLLDGFVWLRAAPCLLAICFVNPTDSISWGFMEVYNIEFVKRLYEGTDIASIVLGVTYFVSAVGSALGPIIAQGMQARQGGALVTRSITVVRSAMLVVALGVVIQSLASSMPIFLAGNLIRTMGTSILYVTSVTLVQVATQPGYLGRVAAFQEAVNMMAMCVGELFAGFVFDEMGATGIAAGGYLLAVFVPLIAFWHFWFAFKRGAFLAYADEVEMILMRQDEKGV